MKHLAVGVLVFVLGCEKKPASDSQPPESASAPKNTTQMELANPAISLEIFDAGMSRSTVKVLSGDLRPVWIVSGRVHNRTPNSLSSITVSINMTSKNGNPADSAVLVLKQHVEPFATIAFSREVQLLPPHDGWAWTIEAVQGVAADAQE